MFAVPEAKSQVYFTGTTYEATASNVIGMVDATIDTLNLTVSDPRTEKITIHLLVTRITGTMTGTVRLYGSNWNSTGTWVAVGDTATLSNAATNTHQWTVDYTSVTQPRFQYYRILHSGGTTLTGTMGAAVTAKKP